MDIKFTGNHTQNENGGINFQATVDEANVACIITREALQDIDSERANDSPLKQYQDNQSSFESIARAKISNNEMTNSRIKISKSDVTSYANT